MKSKRLERNKSKYNEVFDPIKAKPEVVATVIMKSPPRKKSEWRYTEKLEEKV